ncbi:uncharacterized protein [Leptinotarsa decemlineata]|uniref:uncharacterized protein n=1 Tax=Leptinotarsa decemlineata TaxID=7539 RepID=UPI003D306CE9
MSVLLSEEQKIIIDSVARKNGFTDDFEVAACAGTVKGDNYLGVITRVTIKNDARKLEVILKSASTSEALRKAVSIHNVFCREIYIYEKIFGEFKKFQDNYIISNPFSGHAKLYETSLKDGHECLVMENIVENGYKLWNRQIPMTPEHIKAVFVEYAKFHAVSLAMKHKNPDLFEDLTSGIEEHVFGADMDDQVKFQSFIDAIINNGSKALEGVPDLLDVLKRLGTSLPEYFKNEMKDPKWNLVVNHGDCWCNNLMFKYETPENFSKISKVCILDWQLSKFGSPAADLTYFFFAHSPKEVLYDYQKYLKLYHDTVCQNLKEFSCDPEEIFPYNLLEEHWIHFIKFGVYMAMMILKIMYCDSDEAPDLTATTEAGNDVMSSFSFESRNADGYNERVSTLIRFLVDTGLLS